MNRALFFAAMWMSEAAHTYWLIGRGGIAYKARAMVLFDRTMDGRLKP